MKMIARSQMMASLKARAKEVKWDVIIVEKLIQTSIDYQMAHSQFSISEDRDTPRNASDIIVFLQQIDGILYKKVVTPHAMRLVLVPFKIQDMKGTFAFSRKKINFKSPDSQSNPNAIAQKKADKENLDRHIKPLNEVVAELRIAFERCSPIAQLVLGYINLNVDIHANTKDSYYYTFGDKQVDISITSAIFTEGEVEFKYNAEKSTETTEILDSAAASLLKIHPIHPLFPKLAIYFIPMGDREGTLETFLDYIEVKGEELSQLRLQVSPSAVVPDYSALNSFLGIFGFMLGILNILAFLANPEFTLMSAFGYDIVALIVIGILGGYKYMKIKGEFESKHNLAKIIIDPVNELIAPSCIKYMPDIVKLFPTPQHKIQFILEHYACWKEDNLEKKETAETLITLMRSASKQMKKQTKAELGGAGELLSPGIYEKMVEQPEVVKDLAEISGAKLTELIKQNYERSDYTFTSELLLVKLHLKLLQIISPKIQGNEDMNESEYNGEIDRKNGQENGINDGQEVLTHELFARYIAEHSTQIPNNIINEITNWEQSIVNQLSMSKTQLASILQIQKQIDVLISRTKPIPKKEVHQEARKEETTVNFEKMEVDNVSHQQEQENIADNSELEEPDVPKIIAHPPDQKILVASDTVSRKILFGNKTFEEDFIRGKL